MAASGESTALVRKSGDNELMPPPPPPKRIKRPKKVIDEDSYTDALSQIIARDFFPGLLESETQKEYLDALDSKDATWISSAERRLQQVMTPGRRRGRTGTSLPPGAQTPRGFAGDTPVSVSGDSVASSVISTDENPEIDTNMSLGAFQAKYTSEDNESFYKLLDRQNSKKAEKYAWLWAGKKLPSKMQIAQKKVEDRLLESRGSLIDDGLEKRDRLAIKDRADEDRPAQVDTWKAAPNNELMFHPGGLEDGVETRAERADAESRAAPRAIAYQNTRMPQAQVVEEGGSDGSSSSQIPPSPSLSAVRDAIAGKRRGGDAAPSSVASSTAIGGGETPRVNGYAFVDDEEPEPTPVHGSALRIDLGPGDAAPNPFIIRDQPRREALHYRMVDRITQSKREASGLGQTGRMADASSSSSSSIRTPATPATPRSKALTPAAQRLWSRIGSKTPGRSGSGGSPGRVTKSTSTPRTPFDHIKSATPRGSSRFGRRQK